MSRGWRIYVKRRKDGSLASLLSRLISILSSSHYVIAWSKAGKSLLLPIR